MPQFSASDREGGRGGHCGLLSLRSLLKIPDNFVFPRGSGPLIPKMFLPHQMWGTGVVSFLSCQDLSHLATNRSGHQQQGWADQGPCCHVSFVWPTLQLYPSRTAPQVSSKFGRGLTTIALVNMSGDIVCIHRDDNALRRKMCGCHVWSPVSGVKAPLVDQSRSAPRGLF